MQYGKSRLMTDWVDGERYLIEWQHIVDVRNICADNDVGLDMIKSLTTKHLDLANSSAKMNVRIAVQTLSHSVAWALKQYGRKQAAMTSNYCEMFNEFFDVMNIRSYTEGKRTGKNVHPITSPDDERLVWLVDVFLGWLEAWRGRIRGHTEFSAEERKKMFISNQTFTGIYITVKSVCELVPYLFDQGAEVVFTNNFNQDPLESYFGFIRGHGGRWSNPTLDSFGYLDNGVRNAVSLKASGHGNTEPAYLNPKPIKARKRKQLDQESAAKL